MFGRVHPARACRWSPDRPQLDLSGPRLRRAFESLVQGADAHGGVERYVDALKLKQTLFREALLSAGWAARAADRSGGIHAALRIPADGAAADRALARGTRCSASCALRSRPCSSRPTTRPGRMSASAQFCAGFPQDDAPPLDARPRRRVAAQQRSRALSAHDPLGLGRRRQHRRAAGDLARARRRPHRRSPRATTTRPSWCCARRSRQFLSSNGVFRDVLQFVDMLCAQVYAGYIGEQGGSYLRTDFTAPEDPMLHSRRLLGLDGIRPGTAACESRPSTARRSASPTHPARRSPAEKASPCPSMSSH